MIRVTKLLVLLFICMFYFVKADLEVEVSKYLIVNLQNKFVESINTSTTFSGSLFQIVEGNLGPQISLPSQVGYAVFWSNSTGPHTIIGNNTLLETVHVFQVCDAIPTLFGSTGSALPHTPTINISYEANVFKIGVQVQYTREQTAYTINFGNSATGTKCLSRLSTLPFAQQWKSLPHALYPNALNAPAYASRWNITAVDCGTVQYSVELTLDEMKSCGVVPSMIAGTDYLQFLGFVQVKLNYPLNIADEQAGQGSFTWKRDFDFRFNMIGEAITSVSFESGIEIRVTNVYADVDRNIRLQVLTTCPSGKYLTNAQPMELISNPPVTEIQSWDFKSSEPTVATYYNLYWTLMPDNKIINFTVAISPNYIPGASGQTDFNTLLTIYGDEFRTISTGPFTMNDRIYALLQPIGTGSFDVQIRNIYFCYSLDSTLFVPIWNPSKNILGCKTRNLFITDSTVINAMINGTVLNDFPMDYATPPSALLTSLGTKGAGFFFQPFTLTKNKVWHLHVEVVFTQDQQSQETVMVFETITGTGATTTAIYIQDDIVSESPNAIAYITPLVLVLIAAFMGILIIIALFAVVIILITKRRREVLKMKAVEKELNELQSLVQEKSSDFILIENLTAKMEDMETPPHISVVLRNAFWMQQLTKFCVKTKTIDSLTFWLCVEKLGIIADEHKPEYAATLYRRFIAKESPQEINITEEHRQKVLSNPQTPVPIFKSLQTEIEVNMQTALFPQFISWIQSQRKPQGQNE